VKALIVTGGLITASERSLAAAARKTLTQFRAAEAAWLDMKVKAVAAEPLVACALERLSSRTRPEVKEFLNRRESVDIPELAEVVLGTALAKEGLAYETTTVEELFSASRRRQSLLEGCSLVLLSITLLRDLSELGPIVALLAGSGRRVVLGGPLATTLSREGRLPAGVDVLAVGYGEVLVPALAAVNTVGFLLHTPKSWRWVTVAAGVATVLTPIVLEALGVFAKTTTFHDGALVITSSAARLPETATLVVLLVSIVALVVMPAIFVGRVRDALAKAEERLQLHSWHLRQLVPDQARGALEPHLEEVAPLFTCQWTGRPIGGVSRRA
jgi:hypothetical protein